MAAIKLNAAADNAYFSAADSADWDWSSFSLLAWVYPTSVAAVRRVVSQQSGAYWLMDIGRSGSGDLGIGSSIDGVLSGDSGGTLLNTWTHVAVVRTAGSTIKWFRNGAETRSVTITSSAAYGIAAPVETFAYIGTEFFRGRCAEIALFNAALTAKSIAYLMSRPIINQPNLMAVWRWWDSSIAATAPDWSQRGHGATRNGTEYAAGDGCPKIYGYAG